MSRARGALASRVQGLGLELEETQKVRSISVKSLG